jgi:hypothetical protein
MRSAVSEPEFERRDAAYARLDEIKQPVFMANGGHDVMIYAYNSYAAMEQTA